MTLATPNPLERARQSLEGLSVGDAFGERFFVHPDTILNMVTQRMPPKAPWEYTDDTEMAISIVETLAEVGEIDQDRLAHAFAERFVDNPHRGYGLAMHILLPGVYRGASWRKLAHSLFGGAGSFGNGAAMRVAPLGAYFADDLGRVVEQATRSAEVTHAHAEGIAGAIAVAVAAAQAERLRGVQSVPRGADFLDLILPYVPESEVRTGIEQARKVRASVKITSVVRRLGNGARISAQDTVPFTLWCAAQHLDDYQAALWLTVSGLGDRDTTCAIVGGIVAAHVGSEGIPSEWRTRRETLPDI